MNIPKLMDVSLMVSHDRLSIKEIDDFKVGLKLKNKSKSTQKIDVSKSQLLINGEPEIAWYLAVQNGALINLTIPAKKAKEITWPLGKAMFTKKGKYVLELKWDEIKDCADIYILE